MRGCLQQIAASDRGQGTVLVICQTCGDTLRVSRDLDHAVQVHDRARITVSRTIGLRRPERCDVGKDAFGRPPRPRIGADVRLSGKKKRRLQVHIEERTRNTMGFERAGKLCNTCRRFSGLCYRRMDEKHGSLCRMRVVMAIGKRMKSWRFRRRAYAIVTMYA